MHGRGFARSTEPPSGAAFLLSERIAAAVQEIVRELAPYSAFVIIAIIQAWSLHGLLSGRLKFELRLGDWLVVKVSKDERRNRSR
jgi:hypothetical protein